jgi:hypothetical protein
LLHLGIGRQPLMHLTRQERRASAASWAFSLLDFHIPQFV